MRNPLQLLVEKSEGKIPLGRARSRWEDIIRISSREIGLKGADWIHLAQDRDQWRILVNMVLNLRVLQKAGSFLTRLVTISFSRRTLLHEMWKS
jgi:hypothetical protein